MEGELHPETTATKEEPVKKEGSVTEVIGEIESRAETREIVESEASQSSSTPPPENVPAQTASSPESAPLPEVNPESPQTSQETQLQESPPTPQPSPPSQAPSEIAAPPEQASSKITTSAAASPIPFLLAKAREKIRERQSRSKEKIIASLREKGKLSNKEIRKIVRKSRWTVQRYLNQLEREGRARQVGKTGKEVFYELSGSG